MGVTSLLETRVIFAESLCYKNEMEGNHESCGLFVWGIAEKGLFLSGRWEKGVGRDLLRNPPLGFYGQWWLVTHPSIANPFLPCSSLLYRLKELKTCFTKFPHGLWWPSDTISNTKGFLADLWESFCFPNNNNNKNWRHGWHHLFCLLLTLNFCDNWSYGSHPGTTSERQANIFLYEETIAHLM